MSTEEERLLKAKEKLLEMNRKAQKATYSNLQRNQGKPKSPRFPQQQEPLLSPRMQQIKERAKKRSDCIFALTEQMLEQGFSGEEVSKYTQKLENLVGCSDLEKKEAIIKKDIKKINNAINDLHQKKSSKRTKPKPQTHIQELMIEFTEDDFKKPPPFVDDESFLQMQALVDSQNERSLHSADQPRLRPLPQLEPLYQHHEAPKPRNGSANGSQHYVLIPGNSPRIINPHIKKVSRIPTKSQPQIKATGAGAAFLASLADELM